MVTGLNRVISCKKQETYSDHRDLRLPRSAFRDLSEGGYQGINREATTAYWQNGLPILFSQIRPITFLSPVTVAALRGHVFVLERHILGPTWLAYDAHSGRHRTRIHPRSIAGFQIVNPPRLRLVLQWSLSHHSRYRHLVRVRIGVSTSWRQSRHVDQNRQGLDFGRDLR